jgi:Uma2 family endonuclease
MSHITRRLEPDAYPYGWRYVKSILPDGTTEWFQQPLTLEDVLHPLEGDVIPEGTLQEQDNEYLRPIFRERTNRLENGLFLADCLIHWGVTGIGNHSPDLSLFEGVIHPPGREIGIFRLRDSGGRCVLAVEIVSPSTQSTDVVDKLREYYRVRVPMYIILDQESERGPRQIIGHRYTARGYVRMRLDQRGRLAIKPLGLWLGLEDNRAVCYDLDTDERLGGYEEVRQAREAAEQRVRELEAELRRLRGQRRR